MNKRSRFLESAYSFPQSSDDQLTVKLRLMEMENDEGNPFCNLFG